MTSHGLCAPITLAQKTCDGPVGGRTIRVKGRCGASRPEEERWEVGLLHQLVAVGVVDAGQVLEVVTEVLGLVQAIAKLRHLGA